MKYRALITLIASCTISQMVTAQVNELEWCTDAAASALYEESVDVYLRVEWPTSSSDTTALRGALEDLHYAYRRDPTCVAALWAASEIYQVLAEPDSAVAVLSLGMDDAPFFAETIGHIESVRGRHDEAHEAFARALQGIEDDYDFVMAYASDDEKAEFVSAWLRLQWFTHGPMVALEAYAQLAPDIQVRSLIQYYKCLIETTDAQYYSSEAASLVADTPPIASMTRINDGDDVPSQDYEHDKSCSALLIENQ